MNFSSVTISFFIHSTEDEERLLSLVQSKLGLEGEEFSKERITGHFGNEIVSVKGHVIGSRAQIVASQIFGSLSKVARTSIRTELEKSLDEHDALYLRLDRQSLQEPSISLSDEEPIRIKLKPMSRGGGRELIKQEYQELFT
jgi:RNA binding exosome subunit